MKPTYLTSWNPHTSPHETYIPHHMKPTYITTWNPHTSPHETHIPHHIKPTYLTTSYMTTSCRRCKQKVADAKLKRLENIARQKEEREERLEAIKEKLAAGIARRNAELRNKQLRSLAACRWCAARRIQLWWVINCRALM